jgi:tryptophanyl-tRNA synthetase
MSKSDPNSAIFIEDMAYTIAAAAASATSHFFLALQGQEKMSKSDPNSAIFMEDSEGDVNVKIKKAFCPPQVRSNNTTTTLFIIASHVHAHRRTWVLEK